MKMQLNKHKTNENATLKVKIIANGFKAFK